LLAYRATVFRIPNVQNAAFHVVIALHNLAWIVLIQALAHLDDNAPRVRGSFGLRRGLRGAGDFRRFDARLIWEGLVGYLALYDMTKEQANWIIILLVVIAALLVVITAGGFSSVAGGFF
jgi:hypothetical protein